MGINLGWNVRFDDTKVVNSIVMTTCMSPFSKPFLDFDSMQKISTFFANVIHAFLYKEISTSK
jgi:hypothetical protein